MFKQLKRATAFILVAALLFTSMPLGAFAQESPAEPGRFQDVPADAWYYEDVASAAAAGLFSGVGGGRFCPEGHMTRGMAVTAIGRLAKVDPDQYQGLGGFQDVPYGAWYSPYVVWAAENHIVAGVGNGRFSPGSIVTREAFAVMLARYFTYAGAAPQQVSGVQLPQDLSAASPWARDAVITLWYAGLMKGNNGKLDPKGTVSRAQGAALLVRVMKYLEEQTPEQAPAGLETPFTAENDVPANFTIALTSSDPALSAEEVLGMLSFFDGETNRDTPDLIQITGEGGSYTLSPKNEEGFSFGVSYRVTLEDDRLSFAEKEDQVRRFYFTTEMEDEVMNLRLEDDIHYIPHDAVDQVVVNGKPVDNLILSPFPIGDRAPTIDPDATDVEGSFVYSARSREEAPQVGDVVALYDGLHPDDRDAEETSDDKLKNISYVEITHVEGSKYSFENAELENVMFVPDMLPIPLNADEDGDSSNSSIRVKESVLNYSDAKYANLNLNADTQVQAGDFIAFYTGEWNTPTENVPEYARVAHVAREDGYYVIAYQDVSWDEVEKAMWVSDDHMVDGDSLLENVDVANLEAQIGRQVLESGFAHETARQAALAAMESEDLRRLAEEQGIDLDGYYLADEDGSPVEGVQPEPGQRPAKLGGSPFTIVPKISSSTQHIGSGVRAEISVTATLDIETNEDHQALQVEVNAAFVEEMGVNLNTNGNAEWKKWWIFPYIADYHIQVSTELRNYSNFSLICRVRTTDGPGAIELEIDESMKHLLEANEDNNAMLRLQQRYKALMDTSTAWQEIFSQPIAQYNMTVALLFNISLEANFVTEGYLCLAAGVDFAYETNRRYTLDMHVFSGTVSDNVSYLTDETTTLDFYVIGKLGLRAGLKVEVKAALICKELAQVKAAVLGGAYAEAKGFLFASLQEKTDTQQKTSYQSDLGGALYVEVGAFIEITYGATAIGGIISFNPDPLLDKKWPLWHAGAEEYLLGFYTPQGKDPSKMNVVFSHPVREGMLYQMYVSLPDYLFDLNIMKMDTGELLTKSYDRKNYTVSISNSRGVLSYNPEKNRVDFVSERLLYPVTKSKLTVTYRDKERGSTISREIDLNWSVDPSAGRAA